MRAVGLALLLLMALRPEPPPGTGEPGAGSELLPFLGAWSGTLEHDGETTPFAIELERAADGAVVLRATVPALHLAHVPLAKGRPELDGNDLRLGAFALRLDRATQTLGGVMPEGLVPVYRIPFILQRSESVEAPGRPVLDVRVARPLWTTQVGTPLWAGPRCAGGLVVFGGEDGVVRALDARTGAVRWTFRTGGRIRARPTLSGGDVYVAADDGLVYRLSAHRGEELWRVRLVEKPIERLPFDDPKTRYDRFGSEVTVGGGRAYVGTHDGRVVALDPATGRALWEFATGGSVLGAVTLLSNRAYAGSFDGRVYALDAVTGALVWQRDTRGAVVSAPASAGDRLVVGNRTYDLLGLDARTGEVAWKRYVWFSWIESSAAIRDGVAYVGSSDAAAVFAVDAASGQLEWKADALGWAWGQPAVGASRVYVGAASTPGYMGGAHRGAAMAFDRRSGRPVWRYDAAAGAPSITYGFPGSPAIGEGLVFFTGLDGNAYAFRP
jgi:outer membrane protein assembly factor BamB